MSSSPMLGQSPQFTRLKRRRSSPLPEASEVVSEGFIEIVFFLLGVGILLPWNAYISAKQYFVSRLCEDDPTLAQHIEMWFSILYNFASVASLAIVIWVQHTADNHQLRQSSAKPKSLFKNTSNLSIPMMCSKTFRVDTTRASHGDRSTWLMVMIPLGVYLAVFAVTTILVFVASIPSQLFLLVSLGGLFVCGVCTAVASSGIVGTAGLFHPDIGVNPYFNGQAFGGLLVASANFITAVLDGSSKSWLEYCSNTSYSTTLQSSEFEDDSMVTCVPYSETSWATAGYFAMSCAILGACMVGYTYVDEYKRLVRTNSFRGDPLSSSISEVGHGSEFVGAARDDDRNVSAELSIQYLSIENIPDPVKESQQLHESTLSKWKRKAMVSFSSYQNGNSIRAPLEYKEIISLRQESDTSEDVQSESSQSVTFSIWTAVQGPAVSLFFTYLCTLAIFPVWTSNLVSSLQCYSSDRIRNDLFTPLSFVIFNAGDLIGRWLSSGVKFENTRNMSGKLVLGSILRTAFFVLFLFCNSGDNRFANWVIQRDVYSWSIQLAFAVTNGFLTNVCFCYAPTLVENRTHHQQVASAILNFALSFGLLFGSFLSRPYLQLATTGR